MGIDEKIMKEVNKKFNRKRMINVFYVINRMLEEMGYKISLNISSQTRDYYDKWWESYLELREG